MQSIMWVTVLEHCSGVTPSTTDGGLLEISSRICGVGVKHLSFNIPHRNASRMVRSGLQGG